MQEKQIVYLVHKEVPFLIQNVYLLSFFFTDIMKD
jgi:hypothetical protein